jgi:hypothetical protein
MSVNLLTTKAISTLTSLEALKTDDEDFGNTVEFKCLGRLHVLLTLVAVPLVVLIKCLRLFELRQAVCQLNLAVGVAVIVLVLSRCKLLSSLGSGKEVEQVLHDRSVPSNITDEFFAGEVLVAEECIVAHKTELIEVVLNTLLIVRDEAAFAALLVAQLAGGVQTAGVFEFKLIGHA